MTCSPNSIGDVFLMRTIMAEKADKKFEHRGKSSRGFLDSGKILGIIGIKEGDRFLDLGSGDGYFSIAASQSVGKSGIVYAYDSDETAIARLRKEIAEKSITNIEAFVIDITKNIPLDDESINIAFMSNVLHGLVANGEADSTFKEISRVTAYNGRLAMVEFKKQESPYGPPFSIKLSPDEVEALVQGYGFSKESAHEVGPNHYSMIFRRR
jgi:ubiquinone/menaquinone biosynthesis C-methylase UbiE